MYLRELFKMHSKLKLFAHLLLMLTSKRKPVFQPNPKSIWTKVSIGLFIYSIFIASLSFAIESSTSELEKSSKIDKNLLTVILSKSSKKSPISSAELTDSSYRVLVIINDSNPKLSDSRADISKPASINSPAERVLSSIKDKDDVKVNKVYKSLNLFAANVTLAGLTKLVNNPEVVRIGLDDKKNGNLHEALPQSKFDFVNGHGLRGGKIQVAVIDSGIDLENPDFNSVIMSHKCFIGGGCGNAAEDGQDNHGHGSHVSGIIASQGKISPTGGSPKVKIHALKVLNTENWGWTSDILSALDYVITELPNVKIVNMSLGGGLYQTECDNTDTSSSAYSAAISALKNNGILTVIASGNDSSTESISSPACVSEGLAVGAVWDTDPWGQGVPDQLAYFSNSNDMVEIVAPGGPMTSVGLGGSESTGQGTSMAAPMVSSCAALLFEYVSELTVDEVINALKRTDVLIKDSLGRNFPRLDCHAAVISLGQDRDEDNVGATDELVENGDFSAGLDSWSGTATTSDNLVSYFSLSDTLSSDMRDMRLTQTIYLSPDTTYNITFKARSSIERTMATGIGLNHEPWTSLVEDVSLTTEWQNFTLTMTTSIDGIGFGDDESLLFFDLDNKQNGYISLDDVSIADTAGLELINNGDFSSGLDSWDGKASKNSHIKTYYHIAETVSANPIGVNLSQNVTLIPDATYILAFRAKASTQRDLSAGLGLNYDPWTNAAESVSLSTDWQSFSLELFTSANQSGFGDDNSRVFFDMGAPTGGEIWLGDVSVISVSSSDNCIAMTNSNQLNNDGDLFGDVCDLDDDNDGVLDSSDAFPLDVNEAYDTDLDGIGNNADNDDDNDGVVDDEDAFPLDSSETKDSDSDGVGDNADAFPFDASETVDFDGDGIGNNADSDDDNDGVADDIDAFPFDESESLDTDWDGIGNNADTDDDNDGITDSDDNWPTDFRYAEDTNQNKLPDEWETRYSKAIDTNDSEFDWDNDGLTLLDEFLNNTSPILSDSDQDTIPDGTEIILNLNPVIPDYLVSVGSDHICAKDDLGIRCWGSNGWGQLDVPELNNPQLVTTGLQHSCALDADGVKWWGANWSGGKSVPALKNPFALAASNQGNCALDDTGAVCWGFNGNGQMDPPTLRNPTSIEGGPWQFCAVDDLGLVCWGFNGNNETNVDTGLYPDFYDTGTYSTCGSFNNELKCWGILSRQSYRPQLDHDIDQVIDIAVVDYELCVLGQSKTKCGTALVESLGANPAMVDAYGARVCGLDFNGFSCQFKEGFPVRQSQILQIDPDRDGLTFNDGDLFPFDPTETLDTDLDGIGNNSDNDDDGDSIPDFEDAFPLDNSEWTDTDGDGRGDNSDNCLAASNPDQLDTDGDLAGNACDEDDDGDGIPDSDDAFPTDSSESVDSDNDGTGDNADAFPSNSQYQLDSDNDGMPDAWEAKYGLDPNDASDATSDQDNDGVSALDEFIAGTIPSGSLDIDGNEKYDALTDGLLLLRGMFGLDGSALVTGTIASDASYTESVDIEARIATLGDLADIDGNGEIDALTDGLLTLRYLFGLQGDTLINGVVAGDATRKTAEEIEAHLETLMPSL